jgi:uncharacterized membrane protein
MVQFVFTLTIILTGLMAGLHFGNIVGYLPAFKRTTPVHLVPYWKKADEFFGTRMPWFGNALLLSLVITIVLLWEQGGYPLWLISFSLLLTLVDLFIIIKLNTPVNKVLRALTPEKLPENFEAMRSQALRAFYGRAAASILSFIAAVTAYVWKV